MLGTFGFRSPTYFPSPTDVTLGNDEMLALQEREPNRVRCYVTVNPNDTVHALEEIDRCVELGAIGLKLAASRRADDPLLDPVVEAAAGWGAGGGCGRELGPGPGVGPVVATAGDSVPRVGPSLESATVISVGSRQG